MLGRCHACDPERGAGETGVDVTAQAPETGTRSSCRQPDSEEPNLKMGGEELARGKNELLSHKKKRKKPKCLLLRSQYEKAIYCDDSNYDNLEKAEL